MSIRTLSSAGLSLMVWVSSLLTSVPGLAAEAPPTVVATPSHVNPRLKLSYRRFAVANLDGTSLWLDGGQLDVYMVSRRWIRWGLELEGGAAHAALSDNPIALAYGLFGMTVAFQYPARATPFLEGRAFAGVIGGRFDGAVTIAGSSVMNASAATYIYGGGVDGGLELYTFGRAYLSMAIGWVHTTWHAVDFGKSQTAMVFKDLEGDSISVKVGIGL